MDGVVGGGLLVNFYVTTKGPNGLIPYNCAVSAEEAALFVADSAKEGLEVEVTDEQGDTVPFESLVRRLKKA